MPTQAKLVSCEVASHADVFKGLSRILAPLNQQALVELACEPQTYFRSSLLREATTENTSAVRRVKWKKGVRSAECGVRSAECGMRSVENEECGK